MAKKAFQMLGCTDAEFYQGMGFHFVSFLDQFGYGDVLALLGRQLGDFLNGLDNLHEYLKYSYPRWFIQFEGKRPTLPTFVLSPFRMRAPSYFCDSETEEGLILHYRSKRRGFVQYTIGQLR